MLALQLILPGSGYFLQCFLRVAAELFRYGRNHPGAFPGWLGTVIMVAVLVGIICFGFICSCVISGMKSSGKKNLDYVVVLGAHVKGDVPSKALELRLKAALKYARENEDTTLIFPADRALGRYYGSKMYGELSDSAWYFTGAAGVGREVYKHERKSEIFR